MAQMMYGSIQLPGYVLTDPIFPRPYWDDTDPRKMAIPVGLLLIRNKRPQAKAVMCITWPGSHIGEVTTQSGWDADTWPNGVVGTPDGKTVRKQMGRRQPATWVFDIKPDGT
jgi:gluconolactonase